MARRRVTEGQVEPAYDPANSQVLAAIGYDADHAPAGWLEHDEALRTAAIAYYHDTHQPHPAPESLRLHAICHGLVETQLAEGDPHVTPALARLMGEGLSRHDALHAIGTVALAAFYQAVEGVAVDPQGYADAVAALTKEDWLATVGPPKHPVRRGRRQR